MAALLGQPSYAHLKAADATLAATPEAAVAFLHQLAEASPPGDGFQGPVSWLCGDGCRGLQRL
jgi:hypothetical protein